MWGVIGEAIWRVRSGLFLDLAGAIASVVFVHGWWSGFGVGGAIFSAMGRVTHGLTELKSEAQAQLRTLSGARL
jgi:hypothetical protein